MATSSSAMRSQCIDVSLCRVVIGQLKAIKNGRPLPGATAAYRAASIGLFFDTNQPRLDSLVTVLF
ncbi:hypothetical protein BIS06_21920, partial [Halomonas sp. BBD48]|nr:hypothetical protein [Halomonas sp. BBD48]